MTDETTKHEDEHEETPEERAERLATQSHGPEGHPHLDHNAHPLAIRLAVAEEETGETFDLDDQEDEGSDEGPAAERTTSPKRTERGKRRRR